MLFKKAPFKSPKNFYTVHAKLLVCAGLTLQAAADDPQPPALAGGCGLFYFNIAMPVWCRNRFSVPIR